ncbi:MAG: hypothetical protein OEY61_11575 [Gammaproteobacteria bacterium]|nr:hypothetical protein [Gammaproteobacteria bacterium]
MLIHKYLNHYLSYTTAQVEKLINKHQLTSDWLEPYPTPHNNDNNLRDCMLSLELTDGLYKQQEP